MPSLRSKLPYFAAAGGLLLALGATIDTAHGDKAAKRKAGKATAIKANPNHVSGVVRYRGKAPERKPIDRSTEPACARNTALDDSVVVGAGGELQGVHVRVKSGTAGKHEVPRHPVIIRQHDCTYTPRVMGAMVGQELLVYNDDGFTHNIHARIDGEDWFNRSQPKGAPPIRTKDLGEAGNVLQLGCDIHSWMRAYVPLTDHPYFATTDEGGMFSLKYVPKGKTLTIEAWHPTLGLKTLEAKAGDTLEITFP